MIIICFLIAALALLIALLTGVFIAPQLCSRRGFRIDWYALETRDWSVIDPGCLKCTRQLRSARSIGTKLTIRRSPSKEPNDAIPR
jgi:hypothetical protein